MRWVQHLIHGVACPGRLALKLRHVTTNNPVTNLKEVKKVLLKKNPLKYSSNQNSKDYQIKSLI